MFQSDSSKAKYPERKIPSGASQAGYIKRKMPGDSFKTKDPKLKCPNGWSKAKDLKRKFPSEISKRESPSESPQANAPQTNAPDRKFAGDSCLVKDTKRTKPKQAARNERYQTKYSNQYFSKGPLSGHACIILFFDGDGWVRIVIGETSHFT